jgi:hypothetical protein
MPEKMVGHLRAKGTMVQLLVVLLVVMCLMPSAAAKKHDGSSRLSKQERLALIRRAQIWQPTDVSAMDLRAGPRGTGAFSPDAVVECDYAGAKLGGSSRKFNCALTADDVVKVRYGATNGEVEGSVLGTRLLWALGFGADRVYPVRVVCHGCAADPWKHHDRVEGTQTFDPAVIERTPAGRELKAKDDSGWAFSELNQVDESLGGAPRSQRDALTLLAAFMQHTDSKAEQQRLWCLPGGSREGEVCAKPFLLIHDVGLTFGRATYSNSTDKSSVNFREWAKTPVWKDASQCVAHLSHSHTGTLSDPKIGEAGRAFLAGLLIQLTDDQLHDLFAAAHVGVRLTDNRSANESAGVDEWVGAFKKKRDEIAGAHCRS